MVLIDVWRSLLATSHDGVESDDEESVLHCTEIQTYTQLPKVRSVTECYKKRVYSCVVAISHLVGELFRSWCVLSLAIAN